MSTTKIYQELFTNDGSGEVLRNEVLPALPSDLYIDADNGNDENDGLTISTPLKTIEAAKALLVGQGLSLDSVIIHLSAANASYGVIRGLYPGIFTIYDCDNTSGVNIDGVVSAHSDIVILRGKINIQTSTGISVMRGGGLAISDGAVISYVPSTGSYFLYAHTNSYIYTTPTSTITFNLGTTTFSSGVVLCRYGSTILLQSTEVWNGNVTGKKYEVLASSCIAGAGTTIPGSVAGTCDSSSYFN